MCMFIHIFYCKVTVPCLCLMYFQHKLYFVMEDRTVIMLCLLCVCVLCVFCFCQKVMVESTGYKRSVFVSSACVCRFPCSQFEVQLWAAWLAPLLADLDLFCILLTFFFSYRNCRFSCSQFEVQLWAAWPAPLLADLDLFCILLTFFFSYRNYAYIF